MSSVGMVLCHMQLLTPARFHSLVEHVKEAFPQGTASYTDFIKVRQSTCTHHNHLLEIRQHIVLSALLPLVSPPRV